MAAVNSNPELNIQTNVAPTTPATPSPTHAASQQAPSTFASIGGQTIPTPPAGEFGSGDRVAGSTSINYNLDPVIFNDEFPPVADLSLEENIIRIDARAIVYKEEPFNEIINTEFKTYTVKD
tara:strand:+ start:214 stop:579 length:366 start_codon:yes stop_codon:yes gene_type:complete